MAGSRWLGHSGNVPWRWLSLTPAEALVLWVGVQLYGLLHQATGLSSVSSAAHLGGAAAGALAWWWWRPRSSVSPSLPRTLGRGRTTK